MDNGGVFCGRTKRVSRKREGTAPGEGARKLPENTDTLPSSIERKMHVKYFQCKWKVSLVDIFFLRKNSERKRWHDPREGIINGGFILWQFESLNSWARAGSSQLRCIGSSDVLSYDFFAHLWTSWKTIVKSDKCSYSWLSAEPEKLIHERRQ